MIGYIKGTVEEIFEDRIIVDHDGMGFEIFVSTMFRNRVQYGDELKVYTYMSVREDGITLFGFQGRDELEVYKLLITVSGVGPKAAINILSQMTVDELKMAILSSDDKQIAKAQGIGKKTAQKVILELKDKFDLCEEMESMLEKTQDTENTSISETVQALVSLGYSNTESVSAARKAAQNKPEADSSALLKEALKYLF